MSNRKKINGRKVVALNQFDFQFLEQSGDGHPKIISDHQDALESPPITLPQ